MQVKLWISLAVLVFTSAGLSACGDVASEGISLGESDGDLEIKHAPMSVVPNATESDKILVFRERAGYALPTDLAVEASEPGIYAHTDDLAGATLPAGEVVDSFYVHFDHPGGGRVEKSGSVTFNQPILGVIATSDGMVAANDAIKVSELATEYPLSSGNEFGFELNQEPDTFELGDNGRTLHIDVSTGSKCDSIRVIVAPAE